MPHSPDHIHISVKQSRKKTSVSTEPLFPRIVRGEDFEVTVDLDDEVEEVSLGKFIRLEDREPKGNGKRKRTALVPKPGPDPVVFKSSSSKKFKLVRKDSKDDDDENSRYVDYTLTIRLASGEVWEIDPMWDEMP